MQEAEASQEVECVGQDHTSSKRKCLIIKGANLGNNQIKGVEGTSTRLKNLKKQI